MLEAEHSPRLPHNKIYIVYTVIVVQHASVTTGYMIECSAMVVHDMRLRVNGRPPPPPEIFVSRARPKKVLCKGKIKVHPVHKVKIVFPHRDNFWIFMGWVGRAPAFAPLWAPRLRAPTPASPPTADAWHIDRNTSCFSIFYANPFSNITFLIKCDFWAGPEGSRYRGY